MFVSPDENTQIYYQVHGSDDAPCVIFAHGAGGNAASWWQQVPHFSANYRVITFDHRGFARSSCSSEHFSVLFFEKDVLAIMDQENIEKAALICQSMGGWTGVRLAAFHPDRVSCLLLANTPGAIPSDELMRELRELPAKTDAPTVATRAVSDVFRERAPEYAYLYQCINNFTTQLPPIANIMSPEVFLNADELAAFHVPTMILSSDLDGIFPRALLEASAARIGAETAHVANSGHSTYFEQPQKFNEIADSFLKRHC